MKKFIQIFKDNNDWNEKAIVGFISFAVMVLVLLLDLVTNLKINEFIYNSFLILTLGCFGISEVGKYLNPK